MDNIRFIRFEKVILGAFFLCLTGCATVNVSSMDKGKVAYEDDEKRLMNRSDEAVEQLEQGGVFYEDSTIENYLNGLASSLLPEIAKENGVVIHVKVVKDPSLNAFALPNGWIYIHTGILAAAENEAQIATLIGHEMTHVINRHALKNFRSLKNKSAFFEVLHMPTAVFTGGLGVMVGQLGMISSITGYSQELETEADEKGFELIKEKGYDIAESKKMFEALDRYYQDEEEKEPFFFSTHPHVKARVKNFEQMIQMQSGYQPTLDNGEERYGQLMHNLVVDNVSFCLAKGNFKTAERNINELLKNYPGDQRGYYFKGELFRQRQDKINKKDRSKEEDYVLALEAYDQALKIDEKFSLALRGKAKTLYAMGSKDEAREVFKRYLEATPQAEDKAYIEQIIK